jgi:plastocyanin
VGAKLGFSSTKPNQVDAAFVSTGMKRHPPAAGAAALLVLLAACGSSESAAPASSGIVIIGFAYTGSLTVKTGQQVTVTNDDPTQHTLTDPNGLFSTGTIEASGGTQSFTAPAKPGSYPLVCRFHPTMHGTLVVQG